MRIALAPALLALLAIYIVATALALTLAQAHPQLAPAVGFDLTVTATAVFWWLAVRPGHARPRTLARVAALGFVAAKLLVGLHALGWAGIAAEAVVLAALVVRVRRVSHRTRRERAAGHGQTFALAAGLEDALPVPAIARVLAVELSAVALAFTGWFRRPPAGASMHRSSGFVTIIGVMCALVVIETALTHLVIAQLAPTVAIVMTVLSVYGVVWLVGNAHAVRLQPLRVIDGALVIERGVVARASVPVAAITSITPLTLGAPKGSVDLSFGGASAP